MPISGVFSSSAQAESAIAALKGRGFTDDEVSILARSEHHDSAAARGLGAAMGGVLGMGAATFLVPGLGPVIGVGLLAGAVAGAGLGAAAGAAADKMTSRVPHEDVYLYEQALLDGQALVFIDVADPERQSQARNLIEHAGARDVHSIRRDWWNSIRHEERDYARGRGLEFEPNESAYQAGFEAALQPVNRGRSYEQCTTYFETHYPEPSRSDAFRVGFDRGQQYMVRRSASREVE
jgi:hypothetical protein